MSVMQSMEGAILAQARLGLRQLMAVAAARAPGLAKVEDLAIEGAVGPLRARYYEAVDAATAPLIVFFHGGGFVCCDLDTHDSICSWLAKAAQGRVLSIDYRLAPETPFPGQIDDARAACAWALENAERLGGEPHRIVLAGDSAGAYLAARMALELNARTPGIVALQVLLYPLVHLDGALWAEEELRNFRFLGRIASLYIARSLGAEDVPSLLSLDLRHAPPTIVAGGGALDPVRSDTKAFVERLREAGVPVTEKVYRFLTHGGLNFTSYSKLAVTALKEIGGLVRDNLSSER